MDRRDMAVDPDACGDNVAGDGSLVCQLLSFCLEHYSVAVYLHAVPWHEQLLPVVCFVFCTILCLTSECAVWVRGTL